MSKNKLNRILVTGSSGYIGSALAWKLFELGYSITLLDKYEFPGHSINGYKSDRIKVIHGDIRDHKIIDESLEDVFVVIHLAAISDAIRGSINPTETIDVNYNSLQYIVDKSIFFGVERFIFASSFGVYGNEYTTPLTENLDLNPDDLYSDTKANCEALLQYYSKIDLCATSLRIASTYGVSPHMCHPLFIDKLIRSAIDTKKITIYGGEQRRPILYINNLIDIIIKMIGCNQYFISGQTFNISTNNPTIIDVAKLIQKVLPEIEIDIQPARDIEYSYTLDTTNLQLSFCMDSNWLYPGIKDLIKYYQNEP